jgi:hypothetical protein
MSCLYLTTAAATGHIQCTGASPEMENRQAGIRKEESSHLVGQT